MADGARLTNNLKSAKTKKTAQVDQTLDRSYVPEQGITPGRGQIGQIGQIL